MKRREEPKWTPRIISAGPAGSTRTGTICGGAYAGALGAGLLAFTAGFPIVHPLPAFSPALLVATLRLGSLLWEEPRLLRDLVSRPWSRAYLGALVAIPPLTMGFHELGVAPELAPVPAGLVALVRIVLLVNARRKPALSRFSAHETDQGVS